MNFRNVNPNFHGPTVSRKGALASVDMVSNHSFHSDQRFRFLESIHFFFLSPIGREKLFPIPILSAYAEGHAWGSLSSPQAFLTLWFHKAFQKF